MTPRLMGLQKITNGEAQEIRARFASWPGPSSPFVIAEAARYRVGRETIRRLLRGETHLAPSDATPTPPPIPWAGAIEPPAADAAEVERSAARLLAAMQAATGDDSVNALLEGLRPTPTPAPKPQLEKPHDD